MDMPSVHIALTFAFLIKSQQLDTGVTAQRQELCPKRPQHRETPTCVIAEV
jgi:hypothetical protein